LDSSTIVDDISKTTSLINTACKSSDKVSEETKGGITLEAMKIFRQRLQRRQSKDRWEG